MPGPSAGEEAMGSSNGEGEGSLQRMCNDLQDGLDRALDRQRQRQQALIADFLRQVHAESRLTQERDFYRNRMAQIEGVDIGPENRAQPGIELVARPDKEVIVDDGPGRGTESQGLRKSETRDLSNKKGEELFRNLKRNTLQNDIEWLDHAVLQPAIRGVAARKQHKDKKTEVDIGDDENDFCDEVIIHDIWLKDEADVPAYAQPVLALYSWWEALEEPKRSGRFFDLVHSKRFSLLCIFVITLNAGLLVRTTDLHFAETASGRDIPGDQQRTFEHLEYACLIFYAMELALKIYVHRFYFFCNAEASWNVMDFVLVFLSFLDIALSFMMPDQADLKSNVAFLRVLRLLRVSKVFRIFRALKFISELRLMLDCLLGCFVQLFWAIVLIFFLVCLFSIFFVQGATFYMEIDGPEPGSKFHGDITNAFGSVTDSMTSLFQASSGGRDWCEFYELLEPAGMLYSGTFLFYIFFMMFSVFNIVTSIFVDRAMKLARPSESQLMAEKQKETLEDERWLLHLCETLQIDSDGDGFIDYEDVKRCMADLQVREHFDARGISFEDTHSFYQMLVMATDAKGIDLNTFVTGCVRLKGTATNMDLHTLAFELKLASRERERHMEALEAHIARFERYCRKQFSSLESRDRLNGQGSDSGKSSAVSAPEVKRVDGHCDQELSFDGAWTARPAADWQMFCALDGHGRQAQQQAGGQEIVEQVGVLPGKKHKL